MKTYEFQYTSDNNLKSNMDRVIASAKRPLICSRKLFKIQYG